MFFLFAFLFGAIIGSFLNVCILRIPEGESVVHPRSHCPGCHRLISWYDNFPILSFLILKGKCRHCKISISWQYPSIEFFSGLLAMACFYKFGIFQIPMAALWFVAFISPLIVISIIDLKLFLIPDVISLPFIGVGILVHFLTTGMEHPLLSLSESAFGILAGGGFLLLISVIYEWIQKREGIGGGDIKLAAMIGAFLGWESVLLVLFLSSFLGSVVGIFLMMFSRFGFKSQLPYGPFIAAAALIQFFFGNRWLFSTLHWLHENLPHW